MRSIIELMKKASEADASDIHLSVTSPPVFRIDGELKTIDTVPLTDEEIAGFFKELTNELQQKSFEGNGELDFSYEIAELVRYRINVFRQRGSRGMVIRVFPDRIKTPEELELPSAIVHFASLSRGLVLVTGPTGSGKSTTLASLINLINHTRSGHIMTIEDPIEYVYQHHKCVINQREVGQDTQSFGNALRAVLRQDPDVILVGEMRDQETMAMAVTAAETGHLVFSTLHTHDTSQAIDRMIDVFPPHQQAQIRTQLASVLQGVISQQLFPLMNSRGRVAAYEILIATTAVRNMIRESKTHQIKSVIQTSGQIGMQTMEKAVEELINKGRVSPQLARERLHG